MARRSGAAMQGESSVVSVRAGVRGLRRSAAQSAEGVASVQGHKASNWLSDEAVYALQRNVGNQAVQRLVRNGTELSRAIKGSPGGRRAQRSGDRTTSQTSTVAGNRTDRAIVQRHSAAALEEQVEEAEGQRSLVQAKRDDDALAQDRTASRTLQRHTSWAPVHSKKREGGLERLGLEAVSFVPATPDGAKWQYWKLDDVVSAKEVQDIKTTIIEMAAASMSGPNAAKNRNKIRSRVNDIAITVYNEVPLANPNRTPASSPAMAIPGKVLLDARSTSFFTTQGEVHKDAIRSTVVHEMFHAAAINHESMRDPAEVANVAQQGTMAIPERAGLITSGKLGHEAKTSVDEIVTDWFAQKVMERVFPTALYTSGYWSRVDPAQKPEGGSSDAMTHDAPIFWSGELADILLQELAIDQNELLRMYLRDHAKMKRLVDAKTAEIGSAVLKKKEQVLRAKSPSTTLEGLRDLITVVIEERTQELQSMKDSNVQLARLGALLKQKGINTALAGEAKEFAKTKLAEAAPIATAAAAPAAAAAVAAGPETTAFVTAGFENELDWYRVSPSGLLYFTLKTPHPEVDTQGWAKAAEELENQRFPADVFARRQIPVPPLARKAQPAARAVVAAAPAKVNQSHIEAACKQLALAPDAAANLKFLVVAASDRSDKRFNAYPAEQRYGALPDESFTSLGATLENAGDHLATFGGAAYEAVHQIGFVLQKDQDSYYHYLHEIGHFKQERAGISEKNVKNTMLLEYHNFLLHENDPTHLRTRYGTESKAIGIGLDMQDLQADIAGDAISERVLREIEDKIKDMKPALRELIRRNLVTEYFHKKAETAH